jgi:hypothetical protein
VSVTASGAVNVWFTNDLWLFSRGAVSGGSGVDAFRRVGEELSRLPDLDSLRMLDARSQASMDFDIQHL